MRKVFVLVVVVLCLCCATGCGTEGTSNAGFIFWPRDKASISVQETEQAYDLVPATPAPTIRLEGPEYGYVIIVSMQSRVNIRAGSSLNSKSLGWLDANTLHLYHMDVQGTDSSGKRWYKITSNTGITGYVSEDVSYFTPYFVDGNCEFMDIGKVKVALHGTVESNHPFIQVHEKPEKGSSLLGDIGNEVSFVCFDKSHEDWYGVILSDSRVGYVWRDYVKFIPYAASEEAL